MTGMSDEKITINRPLVGLSALACLGTAAALWLLNPEGQQTEVWKAGFVRVGLLMTALWIALPAKGREAAWANVSPWTFVGLLLAVVAVIRLQLKVVLPILVVLVIVGYVLRPRDKKRPPGQ
jgi:hypothetical protein